jgi:Xaa-Pro aminopeptidase
MASGEFEFSAVLPQILDNRANQGVEIAGRIGPDAAEAWGTAFRQGMTDDRVAETADDLPSQDSLPALADPAADHEDAALAARRADVQAKHERLIDWLDETGHDAVLLRRADSLAWFSSGGDFAIDGATEAGSAWAFVNRRCRSLFADNVQSARLFEEEVAGLGFQLKERAWTDDPDVILADLCRSKSIATDCPHPGLVDASADLRALRYPLSAVERQRLRELGRTLAVAVEATCRNFHAGETEAHIAGHLAHRLLREGVTPVCIRVAGDDRLERFRQPTFKAAPIHKRATVAAIGRRHGLCAAVTRTVSFGKVDDAFRADHTLAAMVDATCIYFSRPGEPISEVFRRAKRIYEKFDHPHEWTLDYQGAQTGYSPREMVLRPDCETKLAHGTAVCWSPSVNSARSEDTVVVDDRGYEVVTEAQHWPKIEVQVKGYTLPRPGILER